MDAGASWREWRIQKWVMSDAAAGGPVLEGGVDGGDLVSVEDLEVGGKYRIPKKKRGWCTY